MSKIEPLKLAFNTDLLRYALITKTVTTQLTEYGFIDLNPGITCNYSAQFLTITIKSSHRYAILKLKTELLELEELLLNQLTEQHLINQDQQLKLKIVLGSNQ